MTTPRMTDYEIEERRAVVREFCATCSFCPAEQPADRNINCRARGCRVTPYLETEVYNVWALCMEAHNRGLSMWGPLSPKVTRCPLYERRPLP